MAHPHAAFEDGSLTFIFSSGRHEQTASSYKQHITAMNDEMVAAMNRLLTLKDDVAQALEKLKIATTVNGSSSEMMS